MRHEAAVQAGCTDSSTILISLLQNEVESKLCVFKPGDILEFLVDTFETQHIRLVEDGRTDLHADERDERKLQMTDPNNYLAAFVIPV